MIRTAMSNPGAACGPVEGFVRPSLGFYCTVPAKKIFTLTEYFYKEFKRKDFAMYVFYSAFSVFCHLAL